MDRRGLRIALSMGIILAAPVAAGSPAVVREHPRLFMRPADVAALRIRCGSEPAVKDAYRLIRDFASGRAMQANLWVAPDELSSVLLAFVVEDRDPKLLARARAYIEKFSTAGGDEWTKPRILKALAHAYDWLHADLSADERRALAGRIATLAGEIAKLYRHSDYNNHVYLQYGPLLYAGLALAGDGVADRFAEETLARSEDLLRRHCIPTLNQVGGGDKGGWHESMSYFSFFAYELAHQLEAWRTATGEDLFVACPALRGAAAWLVYSTRPHDGSMAPVGDINTPAPWGWQEGAYMPLLAARYRDGIAQHVAARTRPDHPAHAWPFALWYDPSVKETPPAPLPLATLFPGIGWAAMRSSWEKDAVWALFVCGDYYAGHQHSDQNSFVIALQGDLAIDAGEYGAKATSFHNTVLIGGDQRSWKNDPRQLFAPTARGSEFDTGDIVAFEEHSLFTYVAGDASNAYGAGTTFIRRFLFLKPSTFVVEDQVKPRAPGDAVTWLLHAKSAPEIKDRVARIGDGDGELVCETVLPSDATIETRRERGGAKSREFSTIAISPREGAGEVRFIHLLSARAEGTQEAPPRSTVETRGDAFAVTVATPERMFELTFRPGLLGANEIAVREPSGRSLLDTRLLPAGVLPYGPGAQNLLERWDSAYRGGRGPSWDLGRPSSELRKAVEGGEVKPGSAVELGCGTGTNAIYLASKGFSVTAVDIAPTALNRARAKEKDAGTTVRWILADVLNLPELGQFDFIFDRGCYHGVRRDNAKGYVEAVRRLSRQGTLLLIIAGNASEPPPHYGPPRVKEEELRADFSDLFEFERLSWIRFDTPDPNAKGALGWSALLRRKGR